MSQLELDHPFFEFGCFDDWSSPNPTVRRAKLGDLGTLVPATDGHSTRVASIMVGYDPLGIQVDSQSNLTYETERYNGGFGFTGVAPRATLFSIALTDMYSYKTGFRAAASRKQAVKIINSSIYIPAVQCRIHRARQTAQFSLSGRGVHRRRRRTLGIIPVLIGGDMNDATSHRAPAGARNAIVVGSVQFDNDSNPQLFDVEHATVAAGSPRGHTDDDAVLPHFVAQGVGNLTAFAMEYDPGKKPYSLLDPAYPMETNAGLYSTRRRKSIISSTANNGTSFAAPTVAGVAALMVEMSRRLDYGDGEHPLVVKSVHMTSAAKKPGEWKRNSGAAHLDERYPLSFDWGARAAQTRRGLSN
jgi:hypothetical protein